MANGTDSKKLYKQVYGTSETESTPVKNGRVDSKQLYKQLYGDESKVTQPQDYGETSFDEGLEAGYKTLKAGGAYATGEVAKFLGADEFGEGLQTSAREIQQTAPRDDDSWGFFLGSLVPSAAPSAAAIALAPFTGGGSLLAAGSIGGLSFSSAGNGMMEYEAYKQEQGQEVDPLTKVMVGGAYGAAEGLAERFQLGKLMPSGFAGKILKGNVEAAEEAGQDLLQRFARKHPKRFTELSRKVRAGVGTESLEEVATELAQFGTQYLYQEDEDRKELVQQLPTTLYKAALGGGIMGGALGPLSYASQSKVHNDRRKANGSVFLAENKADNQVYELIAPVKSETQDGYRALSPDGNETFIPKESMGEVVDLTPQQFSQLLRDKLDTREFETAQKAADKQPIALGTYGDKDVEIVGQDTQGDYYIKTEDGQKLVGKDEIENVEPFSPREQVQAEEASRPGTIQDPDTGEFIAPGDQGYEDVLQKAQGRQPDSVVPVGSGDKKRGVQFKKEPDGSFTVMGVESQTDEGPAVSPIESMNATEVNQVVNDLQKELEGKGEFIIDSFPLDNSDPNSPMNVFVVPKDSEKGQQVFEAQQQETTDTPTEEIDAPEQNLEAESETEPQETPQPANIQSAERISQSLPDVVEAGETEFYINEDGVVVFGEAPKGNFEQGSLQVEDGRITGVDAGSLSEDRFATIQQAVDQYNVTQQEVEPEVSEPTTEEKMVELGGKQFPLSEVQKGLSAVGKGEAESIEDYLGIEPFDLTKNTEKVDETETTESISEELPEGVTRERLDEYEVLADGTQVTVVNPQGNEVGKQSRYYFPKIKEYFEDAREAYSQLPRVTEQEDVTEQNYIDRVARESENPVEISEAYLEAIRRNENEQAGNIRDIFIAQDLAASRIPSSDLQKRGLDNMVYYAQYASKRADVDLAMRSEYLSDQLGMDITEDDILDFIKDNPGGPTAFLRTKPEILTTLENRFEDVTGVPLQRGLAESIVGETETQPIEADFGDEVAGIETLLKDEGVSDEEIQQIKQYETDEQDLETVEAQVENAETEEQALQELEDYFSQRAQEFTEKQRARPVEETAQQQKVEETAPEEDSPTEESSLAEEPRIVSAVIQLNDGTIVRGATHSEAINKAIDQDLISEEDADGRGNVDTDLFETSDGRIIDRFQASDEFGITSAEDLNIEESDTEIRQSLTNRSPREIELDEQITEAEKVYANAVQARKTKLRELEQTAIEDDANLFGEREYEGGMFDMRADRSRIETALLPFDARVEKAKEDLDQLRDARQELKDNPEPGLFDEPRQNIVEDLPETASSQEFHRARIRDEIKGVTQEWASDDFVHVVNTVEDLPAPIHRSIVRRNQQRRTAGVFTNHSVYVIADNIRNVEHGKKVLAHEAFGHLGFRSLIAQQSSNQADFTSRLENILNEVHESFKDTDKYQDIVSRYRLDMRYKRDKMEAAEEYIANAAEGDLNPTLWEKIVKFVNDLMNNLGLGKDWTQADIKKLLQDSKMLVRGDRYAHVLGDGSHLRTAFFSKNFNEPFYSELLGTIEEKLPNSGTAQTYTEAIEGMERKGDFRKAEIEWVGLYEWLDSQKGKVSKEDVVGFLRDHSVEMQEIVKTDVSPRVRELDRRITEAINNDDMDLAEELRQEMVQVGENPALEGRLMQINDRLSEIRDLPAEEVGEEEQRLFEEQDRIQKQLRNTGTKFGNWQLPGGENYTEMLITLPNPGTRVPQEPNFESLEDFRLPERTEREREDFVSSHWDEKNVLAHVRFNDRVINGKSTLFLEEIQSDWHQMGRKKGYQPTGAERKEIDEITKQIDEAGGVENLPKEVQQRSRELSEKLGNEVPNAPFKSTWHELVMKRMIRYAAENGYDNVAWAPGEVHNERYDLSKQIDSIEYYVGKDGTYRIAAIKDGQAVIDKMNLSIEQVEEHVGKDIAERILNREGKKSASGEQWEERRILKDQQLEVGGEGMKGFYDKILPRYLNKYLKKWDSKLGVETLEEIRKEASVTTSTIAQVLNDQGRVSEQREIGTSLDSSVSEAQSRYQDSVSHAQDLQDRGALSEGELRVGIKMGGQIYWNEGSFLDATEGIDKKVSQDVWSFPVTLDMKDSVLDMGQPMFSLNDLDDSAFTYQRRFDNLVRKFQDRAIAMKRWQQGIESEGGVISDVSDVHQEENLARGRRVEQIRRFEERHKKPVLELMKQGNEEFGINYRDYKNFLYARHAAEANADLAERNPEGGDAQSGMSNSEAEKILAKLENQGWMNHLQQFGDWVDTIIEENLKSQLAYGLITPYQYATYRDQFEHYVPLRGWEDWEETDPTLYVGPERRQGRSSRAGDILAYTFGMYETTMLRGEKNLVKQKFLRLAQDNYDRTDLFRIKNVYWKRLGEKDESGKEKYRAITEKPTAEQLLSGEVVQTLDRNVMKGTWDERDPHQDPNIRVMVKGRPVVVEVKDPHVSDWLNGLDLDETSIAAEKLNKYMSFLRNAYINYSPEFTPRNFFRDGFMAAFNLATDFDAATAAKIISPLRLNKTRKAVWQALKNDNFDTEMGDSFEKYLTKGTMSGYFQLAPLKKVSKNLKDYVDNHDSFWVKTKEAGKVVDEYMSAYTSTAENMIRFSTFDYLIKNDVTNFKTGKPYTEKQAAAYAKNLTVNFDRKGSYGHTIGSLWLFYNATIQGISRQFEPFTHGNAKRRKARAAAASIVMGGMGYAATELLRYGLGTDDDDEDWVDKINNFTIAHRFMVPNYFSEEEGDMISIPLPYGLNNYWAAGVYANKIAAGSMEPEDAAIIIASNAWQSFNPIGGEASARGPVYSGFKTFTPEILIPPFEYITNENFTGRPIRPEPFPYGPQAPNSQQYWFYTSDWAKHVASALNTATGGDEYESGLIDISPNDIEFFISSYTGGAGNFILSTIETGENLAKSALTEETFTGEDARRIPMVRVFFNQVSNGASRSTFFNTRTRLEQMEWKHEQLLQNEGSESAVEYWRDNQDVMNLIPMMDATKKQVDKMYDYLDALDAREAPESEKEQVLERIKELYDNFNRRYNQATGRASSQNETVSERLTDILED